MSKFDKRKRLEAIVNGERPDRPPVALWRHWPGDDQDAAALAAAQLKWQSDYDWDLVKVSPASSYCLVDWALKSAGKGRPKAPEPMESALFNQLRIGESSKF